MDMVLITPVNAMQCNYTGYIAPFLFDDYPLH